MAAWKGKNMTKKKKTKPKEAATETVEAPPPTDLENLLKKPFNADEILKGGDMEYVTIGAKEITKLNIKIVRMLASGEINDPEALMFMRFCRQYGLDPYLKEVFLIKFASDRPAEPTIAAHTQLQNADRQPEYKGFHCGWIVSDNNKGHVLVPQGEGYDVEFTPVGAWCKVFRKDRETPVNEVLISEAQRHKGSGGLMHMWKTKPLTMCMKCVRGMAHRLAFPNMFGGAITQDEADHIQNEILIETVGNTEVKKRAERTGDPEQDVKTDPLGENALCLKILDFVEAYNPKLSDEKKNKYVNELIAFGLEGKADDWVGKELTIEQIDELNELTKNGLPKEIVDMIPKPVEETKGELFEERTDDEQDQSGNKK